MLYYEVRYPLLYCSCVKKYAAEYDLDEAYVCAIIWTESKYDKNALSAAGAMGVMQITERTAKWCADMLGLPFEINMLFDAEYNIRLGCYYIRYLANRFQDMDMVLAAYNAGEGNVKNWLAYGTGIMFDETNRYVSTVNRVMPIYRNKLSRKRYL